MNFTEQILLISIGGAIGLVSSLLGAWFNYYLDKRKKAAEIEREEAIRKADLEKEDMQRRRTLLTRGIDKINLPPPPSDWMVGFDLGGESKKEVKDKIDLPPPSDWMTSSDLEEKSQQECKEKCLCVLVADTSSSMDGHSIHQLNQTLQEFYYYVKNDEIVAERLEFSIVTFNDKVKTLLDPSLVEGFTMPFLQSSGSSKLVDGINEAISLIADRQDWYSKRDYFYYRSWIILISKGMPDSDQDIKQLANKLLLHVNNRDFYFLPIGVTGADMETLHQIIPDQTPSVFPVSVEGLKFGEIFMWLET